MATRLCVYPSVVAEGMYTCKNWNLGNKPFLCVLLWRVCKQVERVCTHVRLVILEMSFCVYVCVVV